MDSNYISPKLLFKYRSLSDATKIKRVLEIINNHELYFPSREELNDPFEGIGRPIWFRDGGYAGISIPIAADEEIPLMSYARNAYRILSLSEDCFSPVMWSLYADEGKGLCFCFRTDGRFRVAKKVEYPDIEESDLQGERDVWFKDVDEVIKKDLFCKICDWQYEKEWRVIEKDGSERRKTFQFDKEDLVAIIFGYASDKVLIDMIKRFAPPEIKLYKMHVGKQSRKLTILPEEYEITYDGRPLSDIDIKSVSEFSNHVLNGI